MSRLAHAIGRVRRLIGLPPREPATPGSAAGSGARVAEGGGGHGLSPDEVREVRRLHLQASRAVDALFAGDLRSSVRGRGMEFDEVRAYQPGDDIRHIDWNVTARSGEPFVKVFREERQNTVLLLVDVSGSTRVGSGGRDGRTDRRAQLARVAGGLAYASFRNRDRVGLLTFSDRVERWLSPRRSRGHVWGVIQAVFAGASTSRRTDLAAALTWLSGVQRRRATIVVVSDFLDPGSWERPLTALAARHTVHAVCVHDPLDERLEGLGLVELVDSETGAVWTADAGDAEAALRGRMPLSERLERIARTGARGLAIGTEEDAFAALRAAFHPRRKGGR
jgi:uncharacterized protein (DUF58 family)